MIWYTPSVTSLWCSSRRIFIRCVNDLPAVIIAIFRMISPSMIIIRPKLLIHQCCFSLGKKTISVMYSRTEISIAKAYCLLIKSELKVTFDAPWMAMARMYSDVWKKIIARNIWVNCLNPVSLNISVIDSSQDYSDLKNMRVTDPRRSKNIISQRLETTSIQVKSNPTHFTKDFLNPNLRNTNLNQCTKSNITVLLTLNNNLFNPTIDPWHAFKTQFSHENWRSYSKVYKLICISDE